MDLPTGRDASASASNDYRARTLKEQIGALSLRDLMETINTPLSIRALAQQPIGRNEPTIPVGSETVSLDPKPVDPQGVCRMTKVVLPIDRHQDDIAVAYAREHPELVAKLYDRLRRHVAVDLTLAFFLGRSFYHRVDPAGLPAKRVDGCGEHPKALG